MYRTQLIRSLPAGLLLLVAAACGSEEAGPGDNGGGGLATSAGAGSTALGPESGGESSTVSGGNGGMAMPPEQPTSGAGGAAGAGGVGGSGGTGGAAGFGGDAGAGGDGGTGGAESVAGSGATDEPEPSVNDVAPSVGCGQAAFAALGSWENQPALAIEGQQRNWAVRLPEGYDPDRAYPVNFLFHGCGGKTNNVPMENVAGADAIHVRGASVADCWNDLATGAVDNDTVSFDLPFVEAMIAQIKESACVDENRLFGVGYSSGAWLVTHIACKMPGPFRALGTVAGEDWAFVRRLDTPECAEGNVAQMYIQDQADPNNQWNDHKSAMDRLVAANGCTPDSAMPVEPSPCQRFEGCGDYPLQYCLSSGKGHDRRDDFAPRAFWDFFSEIAPRD